MERTIVIFVTGSLILLFSTQRLILSVSVAALAATANQILFTPRQKQITSPWYPSNSYRIPTCQLCGQQNPLLLHPCAAWIEPDGNAPLKTTYRKTAPARLLNNNHKTVWQCNHPHSESNSRRRCAYAHLLLHQEGTCTCWDQQQTSPKKQTRHLSKHASVYIITNSTLNAVKIGIAGESRYRIKTHKEHGWELYYETPLLLRHHALQAEQYILHQWRNIQNLPYGVPSPKWMPQKGYTETAPLSKVNLAQTRYLLWEYISNTHITQQ